MRIFTALICVALAATAAAQSRKPAAYHRPLQRDGAHHDHSHGHDHGHSQGTAGGYFDSGFGAQDSYNQGGASSDYSAGGGYTQAPAYSAPAAPAVPAAPAAPAYNAPAAAPAAGYSADTSYSAPAGGDYGNSQNQGYYYYYYPVQDSKGSKLKNKAKGAWDSMWGSVTSLAGKIPKLPSTYKDDDDAVYGLAVAALVLLIIAAVLLVTAPFISLGIPAISTGTSFSLGSIFNTTGNGLTIDLSFLGIPLTLYNPFFGRESGGNTWGSWFTPENVDKVSSYVLEKIEEYKKKVE